ncbi:MAG: beta-mannosidase [Bacteroidales bacterium]|nr:beta-mannosidase [Bacteroidales bacterium]
MRTLILFVILYGLSACTHFKKEVAFARVEGAQFIVNDEPYYFMGANMWYASILASEGEGGDTLRLFKELDFLKEMGVDNIRVLVGAEGDRGVHSKIEPILQPDPGIYNDTLLRGLDRLMVELGKRDMMAVLYLGNSWEWSGGYSQYLMWSGADKAPIPAIDGWHPFRDYVSRFVLCDSSKIMFDNHVKYIVSRDNSITGVSYSEDPAIFSWQVANEPRAFSDEGKEAFCKWVTGVAQLIKSLDKNHMVSTGSEGLYGCEVDMDLYERIHSSEHIDYLNMHIWPYNWGWATKESVNEMVANSIVETGKYINSHIGVAEKLGKPIVLEEFGYPRDGFAFNRSSTVGARDKYFSFIIDNIKKSSSVGGALAGANFWGWGGFADTLSGRFIWQKGDPYTGDPAQEPQGLYSVFATDTTTLEVIRQFGRTSF